LGEQAVLLKIARESVYLPDESGIFTALSRYTITGEFSCKGLSFGKP
jgi:hypothetical protein